MIRSYLREAGGDYENPSKESLISVIDKLANFASNLRDKKVKEKHYSEIARMIDKL